MPQTPVAPQRAQPARLFREEALQARALRREFGDVLRISPRWTRWAYPFVVGLACAAVLFLSVAHVTRHVRGSGHVRVSPDGAVQVEADIASPDARRLRPGATARVSFPALPGVSAEARLVAIAAEARLDPRGGPTATPVVGVRAELLPGNPARSLLADGQAAWLEAPVERQRWIVLLVPALGGTPSR